ncbi:hypothetical protein IMZ48_07215, partial [Candidatus Bathyarchaeota archaeon]|nr:hypothetical protein [Candidatus Bathyarchaeota archaeon]
RRHSPQRHRAKKGPLLTMRQMNPEKRESLPRIAFNTFNSRFKEPKMKEGFEDVVEVDFAFRGTKEEHGVWARYWL